jgi:hypothetical protein
MEKGPVLFIVGIGCITVSFSLSLTTSLLWVFSGFPEGSLVTLDSFIISNFLVGLVCVILGTIGGFLIGKYLKKFRDFLA